MEPFLHTKEQGNSQKVFQSQSMGSLQSCLTLWDPMDCSSPGLPVHHNSRSLLKLMSIESVMPYNHLILCHPLLFLPSIFPNIRVFSKSSLHQGAKVLEFQLQHQSFQWILGLISFRMDWLDLLAVLGTLKSFLQTKSINSLVFSFLYSLTCTSIHHYWKNHSFDYTFVGKVMPLLFICSLSWS